MSENDLRAQADKWECELMEEKLSRLQQERDEAVSESESKNDTINTMARMYGDLKRTCIAALNNVKKQKYKPCGKLFTAVAVVTAVGALTIVGGWTGMLSPVAGNPLIVLCVAVLSFLGGWIFERMTDNLKLSKKVMQKQKTIESKGE